MGKWAPDGRYVAPLTALIEMARRTSAGNSSLPPIRERSSLSPDPEAEQELEHFLDSSNKVRHHLAEVKRREEREAESNWRCQHSHGLAVLEQVPAVVNGGGAEPLLHGDHQQHHVLASLLLSLPLLPPLHLSQVVPHLVAAVEEVLELLLGLGVGRQRGALADWGQAAAACTCPSCHLYQSRQRCDAPAVWGPLGLLSH